MLVRPFVVVSFCVYSCCFVCSCFSRVIFVLSYFSFVFSLISPGLPPRNDFRSLKTAL